MRSSYFTLTSLALVGLAALSLGGCGGIVDQTAKARFYQSLGQTSITVFPAFVRDGEQERYDAEAANTIGDFFTGQNLAAMAISTAEIPITSEWGMNQAKMFRQSAADLGTYVRDNPIETDYAILAEYLIGGRGNVVGVHIYLVDSEAVVAYAALLNSHHEVFNSVDPQTVDDCTTIVVDKLRGDLVDAAAAQSAKEPASTP